MGFFGVQNKVNGGGKGPSLDFLHRFGCEVCPLYRIPGNKHPDMKPTGAKHPLVYIIAEAPGKDEDLKGIQLIGPAGRVLRSRIPEEWLDKIRWNNVVRTRPPNNREPTPTEIECCRPSIVRDVEETKPRAIFGFGNVPLNWALKQSGITKWNGKRVPVRIGNHVCWFFPMLHPSFILRRGGKESGDKYASDWDMVFTNDLKRAFAQVESLPEPKPHTRDDVLSNLILITGGETGDFKRAADILKELSFEKLIGYDYETNMLRPYGEGSKILTTAIAGPYYAAAIAFDHKESGWSASERPALHKLWSNFLRTKSCRKVSHSLAFELEWSGVKYGKDLIWKGSWGDSLSQAYILDPRSGGWKYGDPDRVDSNHDLGFLTTQYFGVNIKELAEVKGSDDLDAAPLMKVLRYNAPDAKYHRALFIEQRKALKEAGLLEIYQRHIKRIPTMVLTQIKGMPVDQTIVAQFKKKYGRRKEKAEAALNELKCVPKFKRVIGHEFNPGSNPDVGKMFREILKIDLEGGADAEALEKIDHIFAKRLLRWRKPNKILSTYVLSLEKDNPRSRGNLWPDGLVHPIFHTTRVRTWRTSSDSINAQNIPQRGPEREVRKQFRDRNKKLVKFDYAAIQARNVAMESKDRKLVDAFWHRYDIHGDFTERLIRIYPQWVPEGAKVVAKDKDLFKTYRNRVKNEFVFPSFFGAIPTSVSRYLGVPDSIGEKLQEQFWGDFVDVPRWHNKLRNQYKRHGIISGLSGFQHHAPIAQTELINYPIQADESVIVIGAMVRLSQYQDDRYQPNIEIHDDLTFWWDKEEIDKNTEIVLNEMLKIEYPWINTPLVVEAAVGDDWFDTKFMGEFESMKEGGWKQIK